MKILECKNISYYDLISNISMHSHIQRGNEGKEDHGDGNKTIIN